ncbi:hypothetical protein FQN50_000196 [Emmonsiellopsis sp. PD_5]|nr:hypothetical protein FQN50_000196 [Emmonsiellopsis sp. PD_5]
MALEPNTQDHQPDGRDDSPSTPRDELPPPAYSDTYGRMSFGQSGFNTNARVGDDGRVHIDIKEDHRRLTQLLSRTLSRPAYIPRELAGADRAPVPPLNVVIQIVGSRGDVQPFVALGQVLKRDYGHRVRLATHPNFREFVEENGLEFFSIGGDPAQLMSFMVKNPGLMPGFDSLRSGDVGKRRKEIAEILSGCWRSCFEAGDGTGPPVSGSEFDAAQLEGLKPFVAEAIIANPPSFAHIHCAEKLGIPLHLMFTMPWTPTQAFPHPLANIQFSNAEVGVANFVSYALVEMMTWQGLGDIINRFRERTLGLDTVSIACAPGAIPRLRIPFTYCWYDHLPHFKLYIKLTTVTFRSPSLIPKPPDWGPHIDIAGFFFLPLASNYTPPDDLATFLAAGPPPVYIGFGSIVLDDPDGMTRLIFEAVKLTGQRALVSKGWGGIGVEELGIPEGVFMIGNCPHDWLFERVSCVVHHGGAGTTAAGIALGKPTIIIPFFGDQPFWGSMVAKAGAGPHPIPHKQLTAEKLATAIREALEPNVKQRAQELSAKIHHENGTQDGAKYFHKHLDVDSLRCMLLPTRPAVWRVRHTNIRLSSMAVTTLSNEGILNLSDLKLYRSDEYTTEVGPRDPITGGASALLGSIGDLAMGFADVPTGIYKALATKKNKSKSSLEDHKDTSKVSVTDTLSSLPDDSSNSLPASIAQSESGTIPSAETDSDIRSEPSSTLTSLESNSSTGTKKTEHHNVTAADVIAAGQAASRIVTMGLKSPMNFTLGVARGFHNAPKLYGDDTVRHSPHVSGLQSGLKGAGREFGYGLYDGITGLITQPLRGRKDGVGGVVKGFGKGIGGLILKPQAGAFALMGYTMSGIYKEMQKAFGSSVEGYIIASRSVEGYEAWKRTTKKERDAIVKGWYGLSANPEVKVSNTIFKSEMEAISRGIFHTEQQEREAALEKENEGSKRATGEEQHPHAHLHPHHPSLFQMLRTARQKLSSTIQHPQEPNTSTPDEIENAIDESVKLSSTGDEDEDWMIERALRASIAELQAAEAAGEDEEQAYARAIKASIEEAKRIRREKTHHAHSRRPELPPRNQTPYGESSATHARSVHPEGDSDGDYERVLAQSARDHAEKEEREKAELESMTEYAIWRSLKEHSESNQEPGKHIHEHPSAEDLRRAITESLKLEAEKEEETKKE